MGGTYRNPVTFEWRGSLKPGQAYQVTVRHVKTGYEIQSGLLTEESWTVDLPVDKHAEWCWTVSVLQDWRILATSSEQRLWFNPFPKPTPFPTQPLPCPTPFPTRPPEPTPPIRARHYLL
jgi:hypothetical protein